MSKRREDQPWAASLLQTGGCVTGFTAGLSGSVNQYCCYYLVGINTESLILFFPTQAELVFWCLVFFFVWFFWGGVF